MARIRLYVKDKREVWIASTNYDLIELCFGEEGGNLSFLRSVDTFQLVMVYKTANGAKSIDKYRANFPNYEADLKEGNISSEVHPVVFWQVEMNVFPFGSGISGGRGEKQMQQKIEYYSHLGIEQFKSSLSKSIGCKAGRLTLWMRTAGGRVERFDDETALKLIAPGEEGRDVFFTVDHAAYSEISPMAVFPQFENFDELCPYWTDCIPREIFAAVTAKPSAAFADAVRQFRDQHASDPDWISAVNVGYEYLALLQPIFHPPQHGQDYPTVQRRSITDAVLLVATAYSGASADLQVELWSKQKQFPANVLGHGSVDYLSCMPADREDVSALGKRDRYDVSALGKRGHPALSMLPTVVVTEVEVDAYGDPLPDEPDESLASKTVSGALPLLLSQAHDSMLAGSGQLKGPSDPSKKAHPVAQQRFCLLSTGQRFYFFLLLWPDPQGKPSLHYLGVCALPYFPPLIGFDRRSGELQKVKRETYELVVAAVAVCLKGAFTL